MAGDILYFLHRHFRAVFLIGATISVLSLGVLVRGVLSLFFSA
ncbi:hypothetical protein [Brevundimonas diminuta]